MAVQPSILDHIMDHNREDWGDAFSLRPFPAREACVKNGDPTLLRELQEAKWEEDMTYFRQAVPSETMMPIYLSCICGYLFKVADSGGLPIERSAAICGHYLTTFPAVTTPEGFLASINEMMLAFAQEIQRHQGYQTGHRTIDQCLAYIYEHIDYPITLETLAQVCGYSPSRLQHLFPRYTGMTVRDYIRREKIKKAMFLLKHTDLSCAAVGQKLSFCNQSYFIKTFKKETGLTPMQFKASNDVG